MALYKLVRLASKFSKNLLNNHLSKDMHFHNLLQTAAWFHDTGYCYAYIGHEDNSIGIAATFLKQENTYGDFTEEVMACIAATKMPQSPQNLPHLYDQFN
jgi:uncharacterized protein